jgi:DNA-binding LacI/PurR family transcriptional regulator
MSVIGFDDNPLALAYSPVLLTTIRQPLHKMAAIAAQTLNQIIQNKIRTSKRIILPTELVERSSCGVLD